MLPRARTKGSCPGYYPDIAVMETNLPTYRGAKSGRTGARSDTPRMGIDGVIFRRQA